MRLSIRSMTPEDWPAVARIYQEGMDTNLATFQTECPSWDEWNAAHLTKCQLVTVVDDAVAGWAALSPYSSRSVYSGVAHLSIYIGQEARGVGVGKALLTAMIAASEEAGF